MQISKIIESINKFYKLAWNLPLISIAQETVDFVAKLNEMANQVSDSQLSTDLKLLSREYSNAVRSGKRFDSVANAAYSIYDDIYLEEDTAQNKAVKNLIKNLVSDLRTRAGGKLLIDDTREPETEEDSYIGQEEGSELIEIPQQSKDLQSAAKSIKNSTLGKELELIATVY